MSENPAQINEFLDYIFTYGTFWVYCALFLACLVENVFPPFPGDSFIVAAGGLVAASELEFFLAAAAVVSGGMCSVMLLYLVGRNYGRGFFMRKNYRYFSVEDIVRVEGHFNRWGALILLSSRFVVGFRVALAIVAGISRFSVVKMFVFSALSYVMFCGILMYAGLKLVENFDVIEYYFHTYNMIAWPVLLLLLALCIIKRFKVLRRRAQ